MRQIIAAGILSAGLLGGAYLLSTAYVQGQQDRYVTVKGLAEQDVKADLALWKLRFVAAGNDLSAVQEKIKADEQALFKFLQQYDLQDSVSSKKMEVLDKAAQAYGGSDYNNRYIITREIVLRTQNVDAVENAAQESSQLVDAGIILESQYGNANQPVFLFEGLNDLKPGMIADATKNAREAAEQFANDSDSELHAIRHASQGIFQILARDKAPMLDEAQQVNKTVRVVATVQYSLK